MSTVAIKLQRRAFKQQLKIHGRRLRSDSGTFLGTVITNGEASPSSDMGDDPREMVTVEFLRNTPSEPDLAPSLSYGDTLEFDREDGETVTLKCRGEDLAPGEHVIRYKAELAQ